MNKMAVSTYLSIIILNTLNFAIKRHSSWMNTQQQPRINYMLPIRDSPQMKGQILTESEETEKHASYKGNHTAIRENRL